MRYLHNSDIKVHGRLRSSHCVVDSRFMLKIKGFGPKCFIEQEHKIMDKLSMNYSSKIFSHNCVSVTPVYMATFLSDLHVLNSIIQAS